MTSPRTRLHRYLVPLAAALVLGLGQPARAQSEIIKNSPKVLAAFHKVVARALDSTVRVCCDGKDVALGTVVAPDWYILTKASELKDDVTVKFRDGRELTARIVGVQDDYDLAMLKVDARNLQAVEWRDSKDDPVGNWVATVGMGDDPLAVGVVSVATRPLNAPNPSGGFLGVGIDQEYDGLGAKIANVEVGTAAQKVGLKRNDIILAVSGKKIEHSEELSRTLQHYKPGEKVILSVRRGDEEMDVEATLGKRPPLNLRSDFQNNLGKKLSERRSGFPFVLQHDTILDRTDCGGPLVDLDGKAIGINIASAGRVESYAVPAEKVKPLLPELMSGKLAPKTVSAEASVDDEAVKKALFDLQQARALKKSMDAKVAEAEATLKNSDNKETARKVLRKAQEDRDSAQQLVEEAKAALAKAEAAGKKGEAKK